MSQLSRDDTMSRYQFKRSFIDIVWKMKLLKNINLTQFLQRFNI